MSNYRFGTRDTKMQLNAVNGKMFFAPSRSRTSGSEGYEAQPGHRSSGLCVLPVVRETEAWLLTSDHLWPMATSIGINIGSQLHCKNSESKNVFYIFRYIPTSNFKSKINEKHIGTYISGVFRKSSRRGQHLGRAPWIFWGRHFFFFFA